MPAEMHFWRVMKYRCNGCGAELDMRLEDGCEGPPGGREVNTRASGRDVLLRFTPGNGTPVRLIQPVPFTISCTCTTKVISYGKLVAAYKSHVDWRNDQEIDITTAEPDFPYFKYDPSENPQACGIPIGHRNAS